MRSLRKRRARFAAGCLIATIGAACMVLSGTWRNELIAPGPLSVHHAHLVDGPNASLRCAKCHAAGNLKTTSWVGFGGKSTTVSQTELCLACHNRTISPNFATTAHTMSLDALRDAARSIQLEGANSALRDPASSIACSACHREHLGRDHDLVAMSDATCQACHRQRFDNFADGHPEFESWPYEKPSSIRFDHGSHQLKHFTASKHSFECAACHQADASGARQLTRDYASSCAECHDKPLALSLASGVPLISLPTIDVGALAKAGQEVGPWPTEAAGDFDGTVPSIAKLLISAKPEAAQALATLGPGFTFFDVDLNNAGQMAATAAIVVELKSLVDDLATRGQAVIAERMAVLLGREITPTEVEALAARLPADLISAYRQRWFENAGGTAQPSDTMNWRRDDATFSLDYHASGHGDPWLRAWLDALAESASGPRAAIAKPLLSAALKPTAPGQCGACHQVARDAHGKLEIEWRSHTVNDEASTLTHFSHASHVVQTELRDCTACHRTARVDRTTVIPTADASPHSGAGFEPLMKASCVACHTSGAAGDRCTLCHKYHSKSSDGIKLELRAMPGAEVTSDNLP